MSGCTEPISVSIPSSSGHFVQAMRPRGPGTTRCRTFQSPLRRGTSSKSGALTKVLKRKEEVSIPSSSGHFVQDKRRRVMERVIVSRFNPLFVGALRPSIFPAGRFRAAGCGFNPLFVGALRPSSRRWPSRWWPSSCFNPLFVGALRPRNCCGKFKNTGPARFNPLFVGALRPRRSARNRGCVRAHLFQSPLRRGTSSKRIRRTPCRLRGRGFNPLFVGALRPSSIAPP